MRLIFSNISYFLKTKSFFYLPYKIFWECFETLKNLEILINKCFYYCLKFCEMMPQKSSFQTLSMKKALDLW